MRDGETHQPRFLREPGRPTALPFGLHRGWRRRQVSSGSWCSNLCSGRQRHLPNARGVPSLCAPRSAHAEVTDSLTRPFAGMSEGRAQVSNADLYVRRSSHSERRASAARPLVL
jgi:hypothetical protein